VTGRGGRRFSTEAEVLGELERLHFLSLEKVTEYEAMAIQAAEAEATHKAMRAKRTLLAKANGVRSIAEAEYTAEADDDVAQAYLVRLTTTAQADAIREAMRSIRTNQEALRTMAASHRPDTRSANP
jgi:hypothetical protein